MTGGDGRQARAPLAVLYEHRPWAEPLMTALERRGVGFDELSIRGMVLDAGARACPHEFVVNRISAFPGGPGDPHMVFAAREYLSRLEAVGAYVMNGYRSFVVATSKVRQLGILADLGIPYPRTRAIQRTKQLSEAAAGLTPPLIFKPNVGGSGAGIRVFDTHAEVESATHDYTLDASADGIGVLQEYHQPWGGEIVRLEMLGGQLLYALRQPVRAGVFNYCVKDGHNAAGRSDCFKILQPPPDAVRDAQRILQRAGADFGAVEYLISERDGERYFFDVNPFSNYVTGTELLDFDPMDRLVDFVERRITNRRATEPLRYAQGE